MIKAIQDRLRRTGALYSQMADTLAEPAARAADLLIAAFRAGRTLYVCGNGGSAADAQHIAGELVGRFLIDRPPLACIALTTDTSVLTAISNDYNFEQVFARQVEGLVKEGDVLWVLSTSGSSANILRAADAARRRGAKVLGMTGSRSGKLAELCDVVLCVPADSSPEIQEGHRVLLHVLCALVEQALFARPPGKEP